MGIPQPHAALVIARVSLQNYPTPELVALLQRTDGPFKELARVIPVVAAKCRRRAEREKIRLRLARPDHRLRAANDGQRAAVRGVKAGPGAKPLLARLIIRIAQLERNGVQRLEFLFQLADDGDFVAVLQIAANARQIDHRRAGNRLRLIITVSVGSCTVKTDDLFFLQVLLFADATEHQKLGRVESAAAK